MVREALSVRLEFGGPQHMAIVRYRYDCSAPGCGIQGAFLNPRAPDNYFALAECKGRVARCRRCGERARLVPPGR